MGGGGGAPLIGIAGGGGGAPPDGIGGGGGAPPVGIGGGGGAPPVGIGGGGGAPPVGIGGGKAAPKDGIGGGGGGGENARVASLSTSLPSGLVSPGLLRPPEPPLGVSCPVAVALNGRGGPMLPKSMLASCFAEPPVGASGPSSSDEDAESTTDQSSSSGRTRSCRPVSCCVSGAATLELGAALVDRVGAEDGAVPACVIRWKGFMFAPAPGEASGTAAGVVDLK